MRIIALLILIIPGLFGVYGIKLLRDSFFLKTSVPFSWIRVGGSRLDVTRNVWTVDRDGRDRFRGRLYLQS